MSTTIADREVDLVPRCFFCGRRVGKDAFCYGCGKSICSDCNEIDLVLAHRVEEHKSNASSIMA